MSGPNLPGSLDPEWLLAAQWPSTLTLGEWRVSMMENPTIAGLRDMSRHKRIRIIFLDTTTDEAFDDEMRASDFRRRVSEGTAAIVIDDGKGGWKARRPEEAL